MSVSLSVRALKGKRLELSTPNLVHVYSIAVAQHALTQTSKGQKSRSHGYENRHGRTVASDACCYGCVLRQPAWVCMSIRLPVFSSYLYCGAVRRRLIYQITSFPRRHHRRYHGRSNRCSTESGLCQHRRTAASGLFIRIDCVRRLRSVCTDVNVTNHENVAGMDLRPMSHLQFYRAALSRDKIASVTRRLARNFSTVAQLLFRLEQCSILCEFVAKMR